MKRRIICIRLIYYTNRVENFSSAHHRHTHTHTARTRVSLIRTACMPWPRAHTCVCVCMRDDDDARWYWCRRCACVLLSSIGIFPYRNCTCSIQHAPQLSSRHLIFLNLWEPTSADARVFAIHVHVFELLRKTFRAMLPVWQCTVHLRIRSRYNCAVLSMRAKQRLCCERLAFDTYR